MQLEEIVKAVGGGYCRLQMPLKLAFSARGTVAGHRLGALRGGGGYLLPFQCIPPHITKQRPDIHRRFGTTSTRIVGCMVGVQQ